MLETIVFFQTHPFHSLIFYRRRRVIRDKSALHHCKSLTTVDEGKTRLRAGKSFDDIDLDKDIDPIAGRFKAFSSAGNLYWEGLLMQFVFCEEKIDSIELNIVVISP